MTTTVQHSEAYGEKINYRKIKDINIESFIEDCDLSSLSDEGLDVMVEQLGSRFEEALNKNAPIKTKIATIRKTVPWFNDSLMDHKRIVRNRERIWKKYKTNDTWLTFKIERSKFRQSLEGARKEFVSESVLECNRDNKKLYKLASSLMGMKKENQLPEYDSKELANKFAEFFIAKIQTIRNKLDDLPLYDLQDSSSPKLSSLEPLTNEEVKQIVKEMPAKYCDLDAVPTSIIKEALDLLLPTLVKLVNRSLVEGEFSQQWKTALVKPLLKKVGMELTNTSYRPVSNLPFLSKVVEKSVLLRFNRHCNENNLMPSYQSAYRANFSCETALVKLTDDLLWAMEYQEVTPLVAIDLSAAFDTVDHDMLLSVLSKKFGVVDNALKWFDAYLRPRGFQVLIGNTRSKEIDLPFSVPQGSCAGPVLYSAYASTLQEVINDNDEPPKKNKPIELHGFVDDHAYKRSFAARS